MLKEKVKTFCKEYVVDFNGSAAAIRAGYTKVRARITASELLDKQEVSDEIKRLIEERNLQINDSAEKVIKELELIAFAKTTDFIKVKDIIVGKGATRRKLRVAYVELTSDLDDEKQRAISEIKQTKDGVSLKSHDKVKALELLGRHHGIFEKDNKQSKANISLNQMPVTFE